jgi:hypothetical protein
MGNSKTLYDPLNKRLSISHADIFPRDIFDYPDDVEILDISFGHLTSLPDDFARLKKLRVAFFSNNDFEEVPEVLATCENLELVGFRSCKIERLPDNALPPGIRGLILTDNKLAHLPASIGEYTSLKKLMLSGNQLQTLPEEIMKCQNLELLRLAVNSLDTSPDWILELPCLGWYADTGNTFHSYERLHLQKLIEIPWNEIVLGKQLGNSAQNTVYHARLKTGEEVAVKIYGTSLSTDGLAIDDMNASLLAGTQFNIIGGIGKISNAPDNKQGLVLPLISDDFTKLANPPDFTTFTRDVYPQMKNLSVSYVINVLRDVSTAMRHCHKKGIMHGDIYAHNILTNADGKSYIGDFGAASLYNPNSEKGKLRELVDVRGFGCLVEELLSYCADATNHTQLQQLKKACLTTNVRERPTFAEIESSLQGS